MAIGSFSFNDENGIRQRIVDPREYADYNLIIGVGDVNNETDAIVTLHTQRNGSGDSDSVYPGARRYSRTVYVSCRFTS
ncbi:hypothetical protein [Nocardia sp. NBC_00511]|uniref:hypothetical protein n=1 Tax=Nocardia sp. NBC_00511 TaxID=2903591 RepID=UPI0030E55D81